MTEVEHLYNTYDTGGTYITIIWVSKETVAVREIIQLDTALVLLYSF